MAYLLIIAAGLFAGYVNAIAGAGSLLTLPVLIFSGLDASAANATNRISVLTQAGSSGVAYIHGGVKTAPGIWSLYVAASAGAALGSYIATLLSPDAIQLAIAIVMVVMLVLTMLRPRGPGLTGVELRATPGMAVAFAFIGVYAGFIQAGAGVIILMFLSLAYRANLVSANLVKTLVIMVLTVVAIAVFAVRGETIDLPRGVLLAAATAIGGVFGAKAAVKRGERFVRWALAGAVLASAGKLFYDTVAG